VIHLLPNSTSPGSPSALITEPTPFTLCTLDGKGRRAAPANPRVPWQEYANAPLPAALALRDLQGLHLNALCFQDASPAPLPVCELTLHRALSLTPWSSVPKAVGAGGAARGAPSVLYSPGRGGGPVLGAQTLDVCLHPPLPPGARWQLQLPQPAACAGPPAAQHSGRSLPAARPPAG
jgi:hypothetical protein